MSGLVLLVSLGYGSSVGVGAGLLVGCLTRTGSPAFWKVMGASGIGTAASVATGALAVAQHRRTGGPGEIPTLLVFSVFAGGMFGAMGVGCGTAHVGRIVVRKFLSM
ncbi:Hypothetical protein UVM_LOCUS375 [uncultured virus]|nr:Hypothetical protein UVM_LOCUS375 [uncultured virus]